MNSVYVSILMYLYSYLYTLTGLCYLGEYPLAWAACVDHDKRTYNALITHGADPNAQDTFGNSLLHVVVVKERLVCYAHQLLHLSLLLPPISRNYKT